jgi:hypothetical protein
MIKPERKQIFKKLYVGQRSHKQCEKSNQASQMVLAKWGFKAIKAEEGLMDWEL